MFDFLKKKIKESVESIKKVFSEEPEKEEKEVHEEVPETEEIQKEEPVEAEKEVLIEEPEPLEDDKVDDTEPIKEDVVSKVEKEKTPKTESEEKEIEEKIIEEQPDETREVTTEEFPKQVLRKKSFFEKIFGKKEKKPEEKEEYKEPSEEKISEEKEDVVEKKPKAKPRFLFEKRLSDEEFERFFRTMEITFLEANIAYEVIQLLKSELKKNMVDNPVPRGKVDETIMNTIKDTFEKIMLEMEPQEILDKISEKKKQGMPLSILFLGVNGVGKTTNLCKMGHWLQQNGVSIVLSASDTFRAASIEQLEKHAENLKVKVIKHKYGADPAAVAFDAIEYAKAHEIDCVLIDSAGRQHSNINLMDELAKIKRVAKPDFIIFVADALTGNDAVEQAREFGKIGFDAIILGKADVDQKGGAIFSVSYVSGKPIIFLGVGQGYEDLEAFSREKTVKKLIK